jgi:hypothetical protein
MASAQATIDHDEIRRWVEDRGGFPAHVKATEGGDDPGVLRIDYPGFSGTESLERIDWDQWFEWFDRDNLAFLYQRNGESRFSKLVDRDSVDVSSGGSRKSSASRKRTARTTTKKRAASSKRSASKRSASKRTASKKRAASTKRSSTKRASTKRASTKRASTKRASTKRASTKRTASKKSASRKTASKKSASRKSSSKTAAKRTTSKRSSGSSNRTTNHNEIRKWVEARGGYPARVKSTGSRRGDPGILRIDYPGYSGTKTLERVDWDQWFNWFDRDKLAFLYQDKRNSRFSKLVRR